MRKRERDVVSGKIGKEPNKKQGRPMSVRPYYSDERRLEQIAKETGEGKATIVRRMIRFALSDKQQNFAANQCRDKLDWLIKNGREEQGTSAGRDPRIDDILERLGSAEKALVNVADTLHEFRSFLREIYCLSSVSFSSQNLIFTRLLEFASPSAEERQQSGILAAGALANQIAQAVKDLNKLEGFHNMGSDAGSGDDLYLLTKIKAIRDLIAAYPTPHNRPGSR